jgi:Abortive infection alpha
MSMLDESRAVARSAAGAWVQATSWGLGMSVRVGARLARAAVNPDSAFELVRDARGYVREVLGVAALDRRVAEMTSVDERPDRGLKESALRAQGAELLRESADLEYDDDAHPAFARILEELAPDEARILRLLITEGPQPAVDVRSASLIGVGAEDVASGLNMIAPQAGCRRPERSKAYLHNLERLGLVWFSDEPLEDLIRYQVLEAQPEVMDALRSATRAKSVHRSVRLTPFGREFCEVCLPLDTAEIDALTD